jgi:hypothetical protein
MPRKWFAVSNPCGRTQTVSPGSARKEKPFGRIPFETGRGDESGLVSFEPPDLSSIVKIIVKVIRNH